MFIPLDHDLPLFYSLFQNPQTSWFILNSRPVVEIGSPWIWSWM
jgi:hypothetical protein